MSICEALALDSVQYVSLRRLDVSSLKAVHLAKDKVTETLQDKFGDINPDKRDDVRLVAGEVLFNCCRHGGDKAAEVVIMQKNRDLFLRIAAESHKKPENSDAIQRKIEEAKACSVAEHFECLPECQSGIALMLCLADEINLKNGRLEFRFCL